MYTLDSVELSHITGGFSSLPAPLIHTKGYGQHKRNKSTQSHPNRISLGDYMQQITFGSTQKCGAANEEKIIYSLFSFMIFNLKLRTEFTLIRDFDLDISEWNQ